MAAVVAAVFVFIAMLAMASPARAANIVVTSNADSGAGTLRAAVATPNGNTEADTITFDIPGTGTHTITLTEGQIFFGSTHKITVDGTGESVTVSGNNASRVFHVREGNVAVKRLTVSDGNASGSTGGGIYNDGGILTVTQSTISGNTAGDGGGIFSTTSLTGTSTTTIENSTISGNTATDEAGRGGGIYNFDGRMYITGSTITNNYAPTKYQSSGGGAGVASEGDSYTETVVANSIISDNSSDCSSGSVCNFQHDGDVDFLNGTSNSFTSQGHNIIGDSSLEYDPTICGQCKAIDAFNKTGDRRGVIDPKLGPLQDNGGPTQTHALLTGSPAINKGSTTLTTDQRGVSRPQGAADDVGAFELEIAVNVAPSFTTGADQTINEDAPEQTVTGWATAISSGPSNESTQTVSFTATTNNNALFSTQPQVSSDGTLTYTPAANANGTATVTVTAKDSGGTADGGVDTSAAQTFTITVTAVDDIPVAVDDNKTVAEDDLATAIDVLANDTDVDGDPKTIASATQPSDGTVEFTGTGLTYEPNANYCNGGSPTDDFKYKLNGGSEATVAVTVTCVNDAPLAQGGSVTTDEDTTSQVFTLNASDVDGDNLTYTIVDQPQHGTLNGTGATRTYTPEANFNGPDSFTFKANDGTADSNVAKVSITVNAVNDAPVGTDDAYTTDEDTDLTVLAANGLLKNDTDIEDGTLHVDDADATATGINPVSGPGHGQLTLNADGSFTYTPDANFNGSDSFTYKVCDDGSPQKCSVETAKVNVTINPINDAPVALDDSLTTDEDTAGNGNVLTNDTDVDNANLTAALVSGPSDGTLELNADGSYTYTPSNNFFGRDSFTYKANDGGLASTTAKVSITVTAVDDAPTVTLASGGSCLTSTTSVSGTMNLSLADVDSSGVLALSATSSNKTLVPVANIKLGGSGADRTLGITPAAKKSGGATITITASDGTATSTTTVRVIVGSDKKETITGTDGSDMIFGLNGDDTINAGNSNDLVCGGNAGGVINGGAGDDTLDGGNGNDTLRGDAGNDILRGGQGNDRLEGGNDDDTLTGNSGTDGFDGGSGTDVATDHNAAEGDTTTNIP